MSNIKHSSKSNEWYTPPEIIRRVRRVLGSINLDPASCTYANKYIVGAYSYWTQENDALSFEWDQELKTPVSIYMNPPGSKYKGKSQSKLFWQKLMDLRASNLLNEAIVMGFSLEQLQVTQSCSLAMADFPYCIPKKRIKFVNERGESNSPTHSNVIVYVKGLRDSYPKFKHAFSDLGKITVPSTYSFI